MAKKWIIKSMLFEADPEKTNQFVGGLPDDADIIHVEWSNQGPGGYIVRYMVEDKR